MRLFCFSFAGGTAHFFYPLEQCLNLSVNVTKLEYAGHGTRRKEPFYTNFETLAQDLYGLIRQTVMDGETYALFGYSMGSVAIMEVLNTIVTNQEIELPCHIFLAAHKPFVKAEKELTRCEPEELDKKIKERIIRLGSIPKKLIHNQSFWRTYLPTYRTDYLLLGEYDFDGLQLKCQAPATVFYSETDTPFTDMVNWNRFFVNPCEFIKYEGNHFFIQRYYQEIADIIKERLLPYSI